MGQLLHGSARTTQALRWAIQGSQESLRALAARYGIKREDSAQVAAARAGRGPQDWSKRS